MLMHQNGFEWSKKLPVWAFSYPNHCFCCYRVFSSTIFMPLSTEAWKCDFFARHNDRNAVVPTFRSRKRRAVTWNGVSAPPMIGCPCEDRFNWHKTPNRMSNNIKHQIMFVIYIYLYSEMYDLQTKILEGRTNLSECVSMGRTFQRIVAQIGCSKPWKVLPMETHSERFVRPSKIFVWEV